jgi:hypothetical protein
VEGAEALEHVGVGDDHMVGIGGVGNNKCALETPGRRQVRRRPARGELAQRAGGDGLLGVTGGEGDAAEGEDDKSEHHEDDRTAKEAHRVILRSQLWERRA